MLSPSDARNSMSVSSCERHSCVAASRIRSSKTSSQPPRSSIWVQRQPLATHVNLRRRRATDNMYNINEPPSFVDGAARASGLHTRVSHLFNAKKSGRVGVRGCAAADGARRRLAEILAHQSRADANRGEASVVLCSRPCGCHTLLSTMISPLHTPAPDSDMCPTTVHSP